MHTLEMTIEDVRAAAVPAPTNEMETCFRIVYPLLRALGYSPQEIQAQGFQQVTGQYPDYTILTGDPTTTWYLEAKSWTIELQDAHAVQAVNYANSAGKRWVVLTNGKQWRLYDNKVFGEVASKLATEVSLHGEEFVAFLQALAKEAMVSGQVEVHARRQRLSRQLRSQLHDEQSKLFKTILQQAKQLPGLEGLKSTELAAHLADLTAPLSQHAVQTMAQASPAIAEPAPSGKVVSLSAVSKQIVTGGKLVRVDLPSGSALSQSWRDLLVEVLKYVFEHRSGLPLPFRVGKAKTPLVAPAGHPEVNLMRSTKNLTLGGRPVVIETNLSAHSIVRTCVSILETCEVSPETVLIEVA